MKITDFVVREGEKPIEEAISEFWIDESVLARVDDTVRGRAWCFTLHDYTERELERLNSIDIRYILYGKEICPDTRRPHLQGYMYFQEKVSMRTIKRVIGINRMHLERANGSPEQNKKYCTKDGDYVERGERPIKGRRSDLSLIRELINNGATMRTLLLNHDFNYQGLKMAEMYLKYLEKPRNFKTEVYWIYGPSGCGKSHLAFELAGDDYYVCNKDNRWWDGYDGHECVIIDDMRGDFAKHHELLRIFDKWQLRSEVKGGYRQLLAKRLIVTTTKHPEKFFKGCSEDMTQIMRRIDWIYHKKLKKVYIYKKVEGTKIDKDGDEILKVEHVLQE